MGKYGGTILTGRENFTLWQGNLEVELAAMRLKRFLLPEHCTPPSLNKQANDEDKKAHLIDLEEYEFKHAQAFKIILQDRKSVV